MDKKKSFVVDYVEHHNCSLAAKLLCGFFFVLHKHTRETAHIHAYSDTMNLNLIAAECVLLLLGAFPVCFKCRS